MTGETVAARPSRATQVMERLLRRLLAHPQGYPLAALAISLVVGMARNFGSSRALAEVVITAALFAVWLPFWVLRREQDPGGRSAITIGLAITGSLIMGRLVALDLAFALLALALMAQYYTYLPFWVAVLCGLPPGFGSEYSHRIAVLADPSAFPIGISLMRSVALIAVGISFKVMALQLEERDRLQASLATAERKAGMLEERQRLAREIHDTLAQGFAGIVVHLETAEQIDPLTGSEAKPHLDLARSVAREGLEDARRMLAALRPEVLEQRGLPDALGRVSTEWSKRSGIRSSLSITGTPAPMHPEIELTVLRAVQESLTNIARHAGARTAAITLSYMEDVLVLDVQDDGKGFAPELVNGGFGLAGMRERTESLSGSCSIESVPGEGTTISITLPVLGPAGSEGRGEGVAS